MRLSKTEIPVVLLSPDEWEEMPEDQQERLKELERKINQYNGMMKTFVQKYSGQTMKHRTFEEMLEELKSKE